MKNIETDPANISIAVVYSFFGVLSFFALKIAAHYFMQGDKSKSGGKNKLNGKKISREHLKGVNFSKVFLKSYFFKNTLIGSILNEDKKYLLKQIFIMSCMAVSCFNINRYIMWPWAVGFAMSLTTLILSQILIPLISSANAPLQVADQSQMASNLNQASDIGSMEIQINTKVELVFQVQREQSAMSNLEQKPKPKQQTRGKSPNLQLLFIVILAFVSEVLICVSIVKLSLSVSNSGILNLKSFGIVLLIDQVGARIGAGLTTYILCLALHKTKTINLLENNIFYSCCSQAIQQDLKRVHHQAEIQAKNNKIANQRQRALKVKIMNNTDDKMIFQNDFQYQEHVADDIIAPKATKLHQQAVIEEPDEEQEPQTSPNLEPSARNQEPSQQPEPVKDQTNYFELYEHDIEAFTEQVTTERSNNKVKKIQKRVAKPQEKFKSDPLLYLPFQEHRVSTHRNSLRHELKEFENQIQPFGKDKSSIRDDFLKNIQVLECMDDSIVTEEDVIGTILNEKNFNIKTLTINQKAQIPPTSRPNHSATKRSVSKESVAVKKVKKVSPYLVDLQSEAVKPEKQHKKSKLTVSRINKENADKTNQSFMRSETIQESRLTKEFMTRTNWKNNQNQNLARRQ